jgi:hydroxymethylglutaryl-CoA lyase
MANDELVGNVATETILSYLVEHRVNAEVDQIAFFEALTAADGVFPKH